MNKYQSLLCDYFLPMLLLTQPCQSDPLMSCGDNRHWRAIITFTNDIERPTDRVIATRKALLLSCCSFALYNVQRAHICVLKTNDTIMQSSQFGSQHVNSFDSSPKRACSRSSRAPSQIRDREARNELRPTEFAGPESFSHR